MCIRDSGNARNFNHILVKNASDGAFCSVGYNERRSLDTVYKISDAYLYSSRGNGKGLNPLSQGIWHVPDTRVNVPGVVHGNHVPGAPAPIL